MNRGTSMKAKKKAVSAGKKAKLLKAPVASESVAESQLATTQEAAVAEKTPQQPSTPADKVDAQNPSTSVGQGTATSEGTSSSTVNSGQSLSSSSTASQATPVAASDTSPSGVQNWVQSLQAQLQHINPVFVQQVLVGVAGLVVLNQVTSKSDSAPANLPPVVGADGSVTVAENSTALLGTYTATDPEGKSISYSLDAASAQVFTISANGELRFIAAPDFETGPHTYTVVITASDGQRTANRTITVSVTNVNDNPVVLVDGVPNTANTIAENASVGTVVAGLSLQAGDADTSTAPGLTLVDNANGLFVLDGTQVKLAQGGTLTSGSNYTITVKATSADGDITETSFTIQATAGPSSGGAGFDGYLANALVWRDNNANGLWDVSEPYAFTDGKGEFGNLAFGRGAITMTGLTSSLRAALTDEPSAETIDISTGKVFTGLLSAPAGATVVSPLTTLVVATGGDSTKLAALKAALGIPENLDLNSFDPFAAMADPNASSDLLTVALKAQTAALKVSNLLAMASSTLGASGASLNLASVVSNVATSLVNAAVASGGTSGGNLLDSSAVLLGALSSLAQTAGVTISTDTLNAAASAMASVNNSMSASLAAVIASGPLTQGSALNSLTSAVATQLVVLNNLVTAVTSAVSSGTALNATTLTAQFSAEALAQQIEQAKSEVQTIVVVKEGQSVLLAVDDFATASFDQAWSVPSGNVVSNDLSGGAGKTVVAAMAGTSGTPSNLTGSGASKSIALQGQYGVLTLNSDGSYAYEVNAANVLQTTQGKSGLLLQDVFAYTVQAGDKSDVGHITVNIPNRAPVLGAAKTVDFEENSTAAVGTFAAADADGNPITYSLDAESAKVFTIDAGGVLRFKQVPNYEALNSERYDVTITASDGLNSSTQKVTVKVTDVNDPVQGALQFSSANNLFKAGNAITASTAGLSDEDGLGEFSYVWQTQTGKNWNAVEGANAAVFTPTQAGTYRLVLSYTDAHGHNETVTGESLTVASADSTNVAPELTAAAYNWPTTGLPQDQAFEITLAQLLQGYTDADEDVLSVSGLTATHAQVLEVRDAQQVLTGYRIEPTAGYHGNVVVSYSVVDGQGGSVAVSKTLSYNAAPALGTPLVDQSVAAGQSLNYAFASGSFTDADDSALTYTAQWVSGSNLLALPGWLQFNADSRTFSAQTSAANGLGSITVRVSASDGINPAVSDDFQITVNPASASKGMLSALRAQFTVYQDNSNDSVVNYVDPVTATLTASYNSTSKVLGFANTSTALPAGSLLALTDGNDATLSSAPGLSLPLANVPVLGGVQSGSLRVSLTRGTDAIRNVGEESQVSVDLQVQYLNDNSGALVIRALSQTGQVHVVNSSGSIDLTVPLAFGNTDVLASTSVLDGQAQLNLNILSLLAKLDGTIYGRLIGSVLKDGNYTLSFADLSGNLPLTNAVGDAVAAIEVGLPISSVAATNQPPALVFGSDLDTAQLHVAASPTGPFPLGNFLVSGGGTNTGGGARFAIADPDKNLAWVWVFKPATGNLKLSTAGVLSSVEYNALGQEHFVRLPLADLAKLVYEPAQGSYNDTQTVNLRFLLEDSQQVLSNVNTFKLELDPNLYTSLGFELGGVVNPDMGALQDDAQVLVLPAAGQVLYKAPGSNEFVAATLNGLIPRGSVLQYIAPATLDGQAAGQLRLGLFDNSSDLYTFEVIHFFKAEVANHAPVLGEDVTVSFAENSTAAVGTFAATDVDVGNTIRYSLDEESAKVFTIDASGVLRFKQTPNYEALSSKSFTVVVTASDGQASDSQTITVNVTNVNEGITDLTLTNPVHLQENVSTAVEVGTLQLQADAASTSGSITLELRGADRELFDIVNGKLVFKAGQHVDYETRTSYTITVRATDSSLTPPSVIDRDFTVLVDNVADTLMLASDSVTVQDVDTLGQSTRTLVAGSVSSQGGQNVLSFDMGSPLNRVNLRQLFDADPATGQSPSLSFALGDTSEVADGQYTVHAALDMSNSRLGALNVGMAFDVDVALSRVKGQLQMQLPAQTVQLHLQAGGVDVITLPLNNLDSDAFSLVTGNNNTPSLQLKIDNLLNKASDYLIDLSDLNGSAALTLGAGAVMGVLGGKTLGDLLSLSKDVVNVPTALQNTHLHQLIELVQDTVTLPATLQNMRLDQVLGYAAQVVDLPASLTMGTLLGMLREAVVLPTSLQGKLGDIKQHLTSTLGADTVQSLEELARIALGNNVNLADKTISDVLDLLANSNLASKNLAQLGSLASDALGGYSVGELIGLTTHVVDGLYGDKTLGELLVATKSAITLTPELADLQGTSVAGLVNLAGLALTGRSLLGDQLSVTGILDVVREAITVDGVISNTRLTHILELLDATFDLSPILGSDYAMSSLITQLREGKMALQPLIGLASGALLGADGEINVSLGVDELGLNSANGTPIDQIELHAALDNNTNAAGRLSLPAGLVQVGATVDLGQLIQNAHYTDPQGDSLRGVFITQPHSAHVLKIDDVLVTQDNVFVSQAQLAAHQVTVSLPVGTQVALHLNAVDALGAIALDQTLLLQQTQLPTMA